MAIIIFARARDGPRGGGGYPGWIRFIVGFWVIRRNVGTQSKARKSCRRTVHVHVVRVCARTRLYRGETTTEDPRRRQGALCSWLLTVVLIISNGSRVCGHGPSRRRAHQHEEQERVHPYDISDEIKLYFLPSDCVENNHASKNIWRSCNFLYKRWVRFSIFSFSVITSFLAVFKNS